MNERDKKFVSAMERAVEVYGSEHSARPRYANFLGEAECIIGVALRFMGEELPIEGTRATHALEVVGLSRVVCVAGGVAQAAQDRSVDWGTVLWLFKWVLDNPVTSGHEDLRWQVRYSMTKAVEAFNVLGPNAQAKSPILEEILGPELVVSKLHESYMYDVMTCSGEMEVISVDQPELVTA